MRLIRGLLSAMYTGSAFNKFMNKDYKNAGRLFEKSLKSDAKSERAELTYALLGRCYLALEQMDKALQNFSVAYDLYEKNISSVQGDFEITQYKEFLKAYSHAMKKVGQLERSQEIGRKAEDFNQTKGSSPNL